MQWEIRGVLSGTKPKDRRRAILKLILHNRGLLNQRAIEEFLKPKSPESLTPSQVGVDQRQSQKAIRRIREALRANQSIVVYGDYDADGICATAILWETLNSLGAAVVPFIPVRDVHGYGLSKKGIEEIMNNPKRSTHNHQPSLCITVDNGIVANQAVAYAQRLGLDVIICDHHEPGRKLPKAQAIVHTTQLSGAGLAWVFANALRRELTPRGLPKAGRAESLDLATIGTLADLVPLVGSNRALVKHGLNALRQTSRPGILALLREAAIELPSLTTHEVNYAVVPRLNAMGRLEDAMDALRLLCTRSQARATSLATKVSQVNRLRQQVMDDMVRQAKAMYREKQTGKSKMIIIDHADFHEGVIGLIAGKIVEEFYRPTIILARGTDVSKASARSIAGFNIIEAIREVAHLLVDAGGHQMAAGFTIKTEKIAAFRAAMDGVAGRHLSDQLLEPRLVVDCEIRLTDITWELYREIEKLEPFGIGNPKPRFVVRNCEVVDVRMVGSEGKHLRLAIKQDGIALSGIGFNLGSQRRWIRPQQPIDLVVNLDRNVWQARESLEVKIKDLRPSPSHQVS